MFKKIAITQSLIGLVLAVNDWSKPCIDGTCSFEGGDGIATAWSTIQLQGSPQALSDITPAAGWTIIGCKSDWASGVANIQLKCEGTAAQTANCNHLFEGGAATNKVVRLTENCGVGAFARVVSATETSDNLFDVALDYEFSKAANNDAQKLSFSVSASNVKNGVSDGTTLRARRNMPQRRYPVALSPRVDFSRTLDLPPITFNRDFDLFDSTFDCPAGDGGLGLDASLKLSASVGLDIRSSFGIDVSGDIFPLPKITNFALTGTATGSASATFDVLASIKGSFNTGNIELFQAGLPGLNLPGILNIGPQFVLNSNIKAALELQANVRAGATYNFPQVTLAFPAKAGKSSANIKPVPDALALQIEPSVTADGSVTAALIPRLEFGFDVLSGLAEATVFLDVEGSATLGVNAEASAVLSPGQAASGSVSGCATLDAGVAVTAGATGKIPGIFDKNASFDIFRRNFNLFKRCFGQGSKRSIPDHDTLVKRTLESTTQRVPSEMSKFKRALSCPSPGTAGLLENVFNLARN